MARIAYLNPIEQYIMQTLYDHESPFSQEQLEANMAYAHVAGNESLRGLGDKLPAALKELMESKKITLVGDSYALMPQSRVLHEWGKLGDDIYAQPGYSFPLSNEERQWMRRTDIGTLSILKSHDALGEYRALSVGDLKSSLMRLNIAPQEIDETHPASQVINPYCCKYQPRGERIFKQLLEEGYIAEHYKSRTIGYSITPKGLEALPALKQQARDEGIIPPRLSIGEKQPIQPKRKKPAVAPKAAPISPSGDGLYLLGDIKVSLGRILYNNPGTYFTEAQLRDTVKEEVFPVTDGQGKLTFSFGTAFDKGLRDFANSILVNETEEGFTWVSRPEISPLPEDNEPPRRKKHRDDRKTGDQGRQ